jgi:hypothetical protein
VGGQTCILDEAEGEIVRFNGVGDRVWEELDGKRSVAELSRLLSQEYQASSDAIESDVSSFLRRLCDMELVEEAG